MSSPYYSDYGQGPNYLSSKVNFGWIGESFEIYKQAWLSWLYLCLIPVGAYVCLMVLMLVAGLTRSTMPRSGVGAPGSSAGVGIIILMVALELAVYLSIFIVVVCAGEFALRQVKGEYVEPRDIFRGMKHFWPYVLFGILSYICHLVGFIALCVGTYVVAGLLIPASAMVSNGMSAVDAIGKSFDGMKKDWLNATLFYLVFNLLLAAGIMCTCGLGSFVLLPMYFIVSALAYRDMIGIPLPDGTGMLRSSVRPVAWPPYTDAGSPQQPGVWPPPPTSGQPPPTQYGQYVQPPFRQRASPQFGNTPDQPDAPSPSEP